MTCPKMGCWAGDGRVITRDSSPGRETGRCPEASEKGLGFYWMKGSSGRRAVQMEEIAGAETLGKPGIVRHSER